LYATEDQTLLETLALHVASSLRRLNDLTKREHAENEIRRLSQFLESIIDNADVWLNVIDQNSRVRTWNKAAEEISGYSREEVVGDDAIWKCLYPDEQYRKRITETMERIIQNELHEENFETTIKRKDGQTRTISWNSRALFDVNHSPIGSVAIGLDVTEQVRLRGELDRYSKHLEELVNERTMSLQESQERLNAIIQASPEGIVVTDQNGMIIDCNPAALRHYSSRDQLVGKSAIELIAGKDRNLASNLFARIAEAGSIRDLGYAVCGEKGQEFPASISASVIKDAEGNPVTYIAIIKDLTEQNEMQERLRKVERMAVIGETAAMVGHDIRNPIQGISGAVYILKTQECKLSENGKEMLHVIEDAVERSDKIVNDLLDYSRELHLDMYPSNVKLLIDQSLAVMKIPKNINVINLTKEQPTVEVDIDKMKRVCLNLMKNAVDAMPNGGTLTITNRESDGNLSVSFADTGEGIREEILAKIWSPLFTTKAKGMGYGLSIVKRFVEVHGGSVSVDTNPGEGSTFTISLPLKPRTRSAP